MGIFAVSTGFTSATGTFGPRFDCLDRIRKRRLAFVGIRVCLLMLQPARSALQNSTQGDDWLPRARVTRLVFGRESVRGIKLFLRAGIQAVQPPCSARNRSADGLRRYPPGWHGCRRGPRRRYRRAGSALRPAPRAARHRWGARLIREWPAPGPQPACPGRVAPRHHARGRGARSGHRRIQAGRRRVVAMQQRHIGWRGLRAIWHARMCLRPCCGTSQDDAQSSKNQTRQNTAYVHLHSPLPHVIAQAYSRALASLIVDAGWRHLKSLGFQAKPRFHHADRLRALNRTSRNVLPWRFAATPVVPLPAKKSSTAVARPRMNAARSAPECPAAFWVA